MARREKRLRRLEDNGDDEIPPPTTTSSDDDEANEDLSSQIVAKALSREIQSSNNGATTALDIDSDVVVDKKSKKSIKKRRRKQKSISKEKEIEFEDEGVNDRFQFEDEDVDPIAVETPDKIVVEEEVKEETDKSIEMEPIAVQTPDNNIVLRKLLRGPRYFDPQDNSWGTCYNCGEEGHAAANCTGPKRRKPCFVCGSLEHNAKRCSKAMDCFICKKGGHRAKDCPEKSNGVSHSSKLCLICGHSGHDMFLCKNDYSSDDIKEIQCYVCDSFGHLCCVNSMDAVPNEISCYKCGQLGHTGLACGTSYEEGIEVGTPSSCYRCGEGGHFARECTSSVKASARSYERGTELGTPSSCYKCGEGGHFARECTSSAKAPARSYDGGTELGTPSSCYKCGEGGHFSRECTSSTKVLKRSREYSTPSRTVKGYKTRSGFKSEPRDLAKSRAKEKVHYEEERVEYTMPPKSKHRGGWITEDPGDLSYSSPKENHWLSPGTAIRKSYNNHSSTYNNSNNISGGQNLATPRFYKKVWNSYSRASTSQGSTDYNNNNKHRYSASRFGSETRTRNYDWW